MKRFKNMLLLLLTVSLVTSTFYSLGWPQEGRGHWFKASREQFHMADLLIARPLGIIAGIIGSGLFIVSLPFTIPTNSVDEAAKMFVTEPFRFSFSRAFPDEDLVVPFGPQAPD